MAITAVGSIALDSIETPFGKTEDELGGAASYFSLAASYFTEVCVVAVVGEDFPTEHLELFKEFGIDTEGVKVEPGRTFRWGGVYGYDLNQRETLYTELNVFENFRPRLPDKYRDSKFVFLANIDPDLQLEVLRQVHNPALVACDTMNFWIERKREALQELLKKIDVLIVNDSETRELTGEPNLIKASRTILGLGPRTLIVKKGEHGALMFSGDSVFSAPACPLESVFDPTGAGDAFAGGFVGYLDYTGNLDEVNLRKAVIYGSIMASFCVEEFGIKKLTTITTTDIANRYKEFREVAYFEL